MEPFRRKDREGWWIRYKSSSDRWVTKKGGATQGEASAALHRVNLKIQAIREGLLDEGDITSAEESRRPIADVIAEYEGYLRSRGCCPAHLRDCPRCIWAVVKGTGARSLGQINQRAVERWLAALIERGRSRRTRNTYLTDIRAMLNWAVKWGMLRDNPLRMIDKLSELVDRREISRALTPEDFNRLIDCTPDEDRKLYYLIAGRAGLRWQEIRRLDWRHVDLENGWLMLEAGKTKSKRADQVPLAPDVLAMLQARPKRLGPVFESSPTRRTFMHDLARAGIKYDNDRGQVDRKSLRKTFGTHLAMAGVDFRVAVRLMRHTDPRLTQNVYTDPMLLDMKGAVSRLSESRAVHPRGEQHA